MLLDGFDSSNSTQNLKSKCKKYLYYNVTLIMSDGSIFDGMIENIDQDRIVMLVGEDVIDLDDDDESNYDGNRQHGNVGFHRRPRRRFRRFRRRFFPFANVAALELLPVFPPHPYQFY